MWFLSHKNVYFDELRFFFFVFSLLSFFFLNFFLEFRKHLIYSSYVTKNQIIWLKIKRVISKTRISAQTFEKYYKWYVKDTNDFLYKLSTCSDKLDSNTILVTMDVKSLYTNIPNDEGVRATRQFLKKAGKALLIPVIVKFLWLILTLNNFIFNGLNFLQTNGCSMGTKCAPNYANIFMTYFEETYIYPWSSL